MFLGHFAVGLAMKRVAPRTSLGVLVTAPQLLDLLWPLFLMAGLERVRIDPGNTAVTPLAFDSYPYSHSLLMAVVWAALFAWSFARRDRVLAPWLAGAVVSHWVLDWITHRPDMPLLPGAGPKLGLGLWNSVSGTTAVEGAMLAAALWVYVRTTRARDGVGRWAFVIWMTTLVAIFVGNLVGPPPPDVQTLTVAALGLWVFPVWAWWFDRHRDSSAARASGL